MANLPIHTVGEAADAVSKNTLLVAGKNAASVLAGPAAAFGNSVAMLTALGLTAAVSASLVQIEHNGKIKNTAKFYKEELAAKLGKNANQIGEKDLNAIAVGSRFGGLEDNPVIAEEMQQSRKRRNIGVALSAVASVATYAILAVAMPGGAAEGIMGTIAKGIIGLATYFAVKAPLHWVSDKAFGVDRKTTHERIQEIARDRAAGKTISREQVFDVYVSANPDLQDVIRTKYRKSYEKLDLHDKQTLTNNLGTMMHVDVVADAINGGNINVSELAFAAVGQESGVPMKDGTQREKPHGFLNAMKEKWHNIVDHFSHKQPDAPAASVETDAVARSFADRVGKRHDPDMTHLERVEQARTETPHPQQR